MDSIFPYNGKLKDLTADKQGLILVLIYSHKTNTYFACFFPLTSKDGTPE